MTKRQFARAIAVALFCAEALCAKTKKKSQAARAPAPQAAATRAEPAWLSDEGRRKMFPPAFYVSAVSYGASADEAKSKSAAALSEYVKSSVKSQTQSRYAAVGGGGAFRENSSVNSDAAVSSQNDLYQIEYTAPCYDSDMALFACAAYISRQRAFEFARPKLEKAAALFPSEYEKALAIDDTFQKVMAIRESQKSLDSFYEVYDFARAMDSDSAAEYASVDTLASESSAHAAALARQAQFRVFAAGDKGGVVAAAIEAAIGDLGFTVIKTKAAEYYAEAAVTVEIQKAEKAFVCYPSVAVEIKRGPNVIASYSREIGKVGGFDKDTTERTAYNKIAQVLRENFLR